MVDNQILVNEIMKDTKMDFNIKSWRKQSALRLDFNLEAMWSIWLRLMLIASTGLLQKYQSRNVYTEFLYKTSCSQQSNPLLLKYYIST